MTKRESYKEGINLDFYAKNDIEELIVVEVKYTVTEGAFSSSDVVQVTF